MIIYNSSGTQILSVAVNDNSFRNRRIMGDHNLTLHFSLAEHIEIPVGAYCEFEGERYTLERPENLKMKHSRYFEYTVIFESPEAKAKIWKFRNTVDGRLKFSLTATPREHLQMFVDNMNRVIDCYANGKIILEAPFLNWVKPEIISYCKANSLPVHFTYSCESGKVPPCGRCLSCLDRKEYLDGQI